MNVLVLRGRAFLWVTITVVVLSLPSSRRYGGVGQLPGVSAVTAAVALTGGLTVMMLRRHRGWVRHHLGTELTVAWLMLMTVACGEEVVFRGLTLRAIASSLGMAAALMLSSVAFGFAHFRRGRSGDALIHTVTGLAFGAIAWVTSGWLASAALHTAYNWIVYGWGPVASGGAGEEAMITRETTVTSLGQEGERHRDCRQDPRVIMKEA